MPAKTPAKTPQTEQEISVDYRIEVPAPLVFRYWAENTLLHPDQILKRTGTRLVRFTWNGKEAEGSVAEIQFEPQGARACLVKVKHTGISDDMAARVMAQRWADELEALEAHALERQEIPTLELQVLSGPVSKPN